MLDDEIARQGLKKCSGNVFISLSNICFPLIYCQKFVADEIVIGDDEYSVKSKSA